MRLLELAGPSIECVIYPDGDVLTSRPVAGYTDQVTRAMRPDRESFALGMYNHGLVTVGHHAGVLSHGCHRCAPFSMCLGDWRDEFAGRSSMHQPALSAVVKKKTCTVFGLPPKSYQFPQPRRGLAPEAIFAHFTGMRRKSGSTTAPPKI